MVLALSTSLVVCPESVSLQPDRSLTVKLAVTSSRLARTPMSSEIEREPPFRSNKTYTLGCLFRGLFVPQNCHLHRVIAYMVSACGNCQSRKMAAITPRGNAWRAAGPLRAFDENLSSKSRGKLGFKCTQTSLCCKLVGRKAKL